MHYEIGSKLRHAIVEDEGIRIMEKRETRFVPFSKIVSVSVRKPGLLSGGHIFFQTAADGANPLSSRNAVPFTGKENYELACKIKAEVERLI